jgi:moderate conductance mechanosensitive channel
MTPTTNVAGRCVLLAAWLAMAITVTIALGSAAAASDAAGITVVARPGMGQAQIEALLQAARATGQPVTLRWEDGPAATATAPPATAPPATSAPAAGARPAGGSPATGSDGATAAAPGVRFLDSLEAGFDARVAGAGRLAELPRNVVAAWGQGVDGAFALILLLAGAALAALAVRRVLPAPRPPAPPPSEAGADVLGRLRASAAHLARDAVALATFVVCGWLGIRWLFGSADGAQALAVRVLRYCAVIGFYAAAGRFLLAPGDEGRRLLQLPRAEWHFRMLMIYGTCGAILEFIAAAARWARTDTMVVDGWFLIAGSAITLLKVGWFFAGRHDITKLFAGGEGAGAIRRAAAIAWPWLLMASAILIWAAVATAGADPQGENWVSAAGTTQVTAILLPIVALGIGEIARALARRHAAAAPPRPLRRAAGAAGRTLLIGGIWLAGLFLVARVWGVALDASGAGATVAALVRLGAAVITGLTLWTFLHAYFAAHLPAARGGQPGEEDEGVPVVQSRLTTVLPILRDLTLGAVIAVTALVVMSGLGMDIAPLLAGFGVVGLAISFGSQALVRDIVSGIFFMSDDAFRLGEYVDTGRLKGTVEKITLRSVQLRHQNGQIHTIPFGQLQAVTNFSRDWSTVKFTLRLDRDADIEKARKTIKKVGQAMLEDPELGREFIQPLKMQGLQEIADSAIVVRCKFTCKPHQPTFLQREALKRLYRALQEAGVPLASNAVVVRTSPQEQNGAERSVPGAAVHIAGQATTAA